MTGFVRAANNVSIIHGDITQAKVDAIVNAANPVMLGGGGVDGAIHRAAGPKLRQLCLNIEPVDGVRCPVGQARVTAAANLAARFVIHAVGPRYNYDRNPSALLTSVYQQSLDLALHNLCGSIAFPAISCGVYAYPTQQAAQIAAAVCLRDCYRELDIRFYLLERQVFDTWIAVFSKLTQTI